MQIVRRNDINGRVLPEGTRITPENCPQLQEILNQIYYVNREVVENEKSA